MPEFTHNASKFQYFLLTPHYTIPTFNDPK